MGKPEASVLEALIAGICIAASVTLIIGVLLLRAAEFDDVARLFYRYTTTAAVLGGAVLTLRCLSAVLWLGIRSRLRASPFAASRVWVSDWWRRGGAAHFIWPLLTFATLMTGFNAFKQAVLPMAGMHYDELFAAIDQWMFLGNDPGLLLHEWMGSPAISRWLDAVYHAWFLPMSVGVAVVAVFAGDRMRMRYMLTYVAIWVVLGVAMAYALPAAGPCFWADFVAPGRFDPLMNTLYEHQAALGPDVEIAALKYQQTLLTAWGSSELRVGRGISAMPSVHNALAVLFALAAFQYRRWLGVVFGLFAFLIWIGSIYLGWHYAIDGLVGGGAAAVFWWLSGKMIRDKSTYPEKGMSSVIGIRRSAGGT